MKMTATQTTKGDTMKQVKITLENKTYPVRKGIMDQVFILIDEGEDVNDEVTKKVEEWVTSRHNNFAPGDCITISQAEDVEVPTHLQGVNLTGLMENCIAGLKK